MCIQIPEPFTTQAEVGSVVVIPTYKASSIWCHSLLGIKFVSNRLDGGSKDGPGIRCPNKPERSGKVWGRQEFCQRLLTTANLEGGALHSTGSEPGITVGHEGATLYLITLYSWYKVSTR